MKLSERIRPHSEAAPWVIVEVAQLEERNAALLNALREISLCSTNSASSKEECGSIARAALAVK